MDQTKSSSYKKQLVSNSKDTTLGHSFIIRVTEAEELTNQLLKFILHYVTTNATNSYDCHVTTVKKRQVASTLGRIYVLKYHSEIRTDDKSNTAEQPILHTTLEL